MTPALADAIWTVLVNVAAAREDDRGSFVDYFVDDDHFREWRFCGSLGFGGKVKFYPHRSVPAYVDTYPETMTPERADTIRRCNEALAVLFAEVQP